MTLVASGLRSGEMAERLLLSPETIKSHLHNAMVKLGSHTRACRGDRVGDGTDRVDGLDGVADTHAFGGLRSSTEAPIVSQRRFGSNP